MIYSTMALETIFNDSMGVRRTGHFEYQVRWLLTDSRSLSTPEGTLFFALTSRQGDGHRYIEELYQRGVRCFVVKRLPSEVHPDAVYFLVRSTLEALQQLASYHRRQFQIPVIGIAGSNGKTTVKEWLFQLLSPDHVVTRSPRSYNSQIGVPLSVWNLSTDTQLGVFEAAISQPGEMRPLQHILRPTIGLFTCLGDAHQENFQSMEQKCREKLLLFRNAQVLIYPQGNPVIDKCVSQMEFKGQLMPVDTSAAATPMEVNKLLCRAVCLYLGMKPQEVFDRLAQLEPVAMRLEVKEGQNGCTVINDSYNNDLASLDIALDFMTRRPVPKDEARKSQGTALILSDIQQTGLEPQVLYERVATLVQSRHVDMFVGVGPELMAHAGLFPGGHFFATTRQLLESPLLTELHNRVILVKGARSFHFENVVDRLELRVHETILEVNLDAIVQNLNYHRRFLHPDTRLVCMVKAGAYGAGSLEVSRILQDHKVDYLAVAVADEGVELRRGGISTGIMIMNPEMSCFRTLFRYNLEPEVYSFRLLKALIQAAEAEGITGFPVHIKLDTGMHRLGFNPETDMPELIHLLTHQHAVLPRSVFSHFVGSDADEFDAFSHRQYELFVRGADALQQAYPQHHILRHICNSAGITHFPQYDNDMCRLGLGLYGIDSRTNRLIHNVSTLKTTILQLRNVPAGDTVGYSRRGVLTRDSLIATLPIGYADGLDRRLGCGRGYCLVNGHKAPYVGNICMDVCMIDVTGIPCQEGDTAIIFGEQLSPSVLADLIGTIPYEIFTSVSQRVKRVFFRRS